MYRLGRIARWGIAALALAYIATVIYSLPRAYQARVDAGTVEKIADARITAAIVEGQNLPFVPESAANSTIAGVDANEDGVRDDVELAIFAAHPTTTAVRAAELQYAMDLQMQLTLVNDGATWRAAIIQHQRGFGCLYDVTSGAYSALYNEVNALVLNTAARKAKYNAIETYATAYTLSSGPDCDLAQS